MTPLYLTKKVVKDALDANGAISEECDECAAPGPGGLGCTLSRNHITAHVAYVEDEPVAVWVNVRCEISLIPSEEA